MELYLTVSQESELPPVVEHDPVEFVFEPPPGTQARVVMNGQLLDPFLRPGEPYWRWRWNPGAAVGVHQASLTLLGPDGPVSEQTWKLRIIPRKIDQERYETLLLDIQQTTYRLVVALAGLGSEYAALQSDTAWIRGAAEEYYVLFEERLDGFERAVRKIAERPRTSIGTTSEQMPAGQAKQIDARSIVQATRGSFDEAPPGVADAVQEAFRPGGGFLPRELTETRSVSTNDTYEHRLLKRLLELLSIRAQRIGGLARSELRHIATNERLSGIASVRRTRLEYLAAGCDEAIRRLRELRALPLLNGVGPLASVHGPTPLFQRDPAYRAVYRMWRDLRRQPYLNIDNPLFQLPIADLPRLYERWCALQVAQAMLGLGGTLVEQRLVEHRSGEHDDQELEARVQLPENTPLVVLDHAIGRLTLRYQPHYRPSAGRLARLSSLDRHTHIPDLAIEIDRAEEVPIVLLLDAKYRLESDGRSVPQDALADAYVYLGAIGYSGTRTTLGAVLLYPGEGKPERYQSGVGILPLIPGHTKELAEELARWLKVTKHLLQ